MVNLKNYDIFVDKRTSKNGNDYTALFIKVGDKEHLIDFIPSSLYDYILNLSK